MLPFNSAHSHTHLFCCPLESSHDRILDLIEVLYSLCAVHEQVRPGTLRTKAPDLTTLVGIITILLNEVPGSLLGLLAWSDLTLQGKEEGKGERSKGDSEGLMSGQFSECINL